MRQGRPVEEKHPRSDYRKQKREGIISQIADGPHTTLPLPLTKSTEMTDLRKTQPMSGHITESYLKAISGSLWLGTADL